jgi:hypothetical protein
MKTIIAGSRTYTNENAVWDIVDRCPWEITEVVCGEAAGPDTLGKRWARKESITVASFPADWNQHGRGAGHIRNRQMAEHAEACIVFWDGASRGARNMIDEALSCGLHLLVVKV